MTDKVYYNGVEYIFPSRELFEVVLKEWSCTVTDMNGRELLMWAGTISSETSKGSADFLCNLTDDITYTYNVPRSEWVKTTNALSATIDAYN